MPEVQSVELMLSSTFYLLNICMHVYTHRSSVYRWSLTGLTGTKWSNSSNWSRACQLTKTQTTKTNLKLSTFSTRQASLKVRSANTSPPAHDSRRAFLIEIELLNRNRVRSGLPASRLESGLHMALERSATLEPFIEAVFGTSTTTTKHLGAPALLSARDSVAALKGERAQERKETSWHKSTQGNFCVSRA